MNADINFEEEKKGEDDDWDIGVSDRVGADIGEV